MKSQSVNVVANPDKTTARGKRVQFIGHLLAADCSVTRYRTATNVMQTGAGAFVTSPVGLRAPVVGSMAKLRGVFPMVGYSSLRWRVPFIGSMETAEMVSMPARLEA